MTKKYYDVFVNNVFFKKIFFKKERSNNDLLFDLIMMFTCTADNDVNKIIDTFLHGADCIKKERIITFESPKGNTIDLIPFIN